MCSGFLDTKNEVALQHEWLKAHMIHKDLFKDCWDPPAGNSNFWSGKIHQVQGCLTTWCTEHFEASTSLPHPPHPAPLPPALGNPWAFDCRPCPGSREFDKKGPPVCGEFESCLGGVGNLNRKCQIWTSQGIARGGGCWSFKLIGALNCG